MFSEVCFRVIMSQVGQAQIPPICMLDASAHAIALASASTAAERARRALLQC
jgi:hypothetical protein